MTHIIRTLLAAGRFIVDILALLGRTFLDPNPEARTAAIHPVRAALVLFTLSALASPRFMWPCVALAFILVAESLASRFPKK